MKNIVKKSVGVILILLTLISTLTGCTNKEYFWGDSTLRNDWNADLSINSKLVSSNKIFELCDVTLDFFYSLYSINSNESLDQIKEKYTYVPSVNESERYLYTETVYAIYLSNNEELIFEKNENEAIIDYENKVNGILWRFISYEEAFSTNYGYTTMRKNGSWLQEIKYNYKESITIPSELFAPVNEKIYIHIVRLAHTPQNGLYTCVEHSIRTLAIRYILIGDDKVVFI